MIKGYKDAKRPHTNMEIRCMNVILLNLQNRKSNKNKGLQIRFIDAISPIIFVDLTYNLTKITKKTKMKLKTRNKSPKKFVKMHMMKFGR